MRFIVGFIGIPLGFVIIVYREKIKRFTGDFQWAEKHLGSGGTYTAILIFGLFVTIASLMYILGTLQAILGNLLGSFFPTRKQ